MKVLQAINKAKALLKEQGLEDWSVFTNDSSVTVAKVDLDRKRLTYSKRYITIATEDEFYRTTMHEIAHALLPYEAGHGDEFVEKCRELNPDKPYDLHCIYAPIHKYNMVCPKCDRGCGTNSMKGLACPYCKVELVRTPNILEPIEWASIS